MMPNRTALLDLRWAVDHLQDAYDAAAECLFAIRGDAGPTVHARALDRSGTVLERFLNSQPMLETPARRPLLRCWEGYQHVAPDFLKALRNEGSSTQPSFASFAATAQASMSWCSELLQGMAQGDAGWRLWMPALFAHLTSLAGAAHARTKLHLLASGEPLGTAAFAETMRQCMLQGLRDVQEQSERIIRWSWDAETAIAEDRDIVLMVTRWVGGMQQLDSHGRLQVVRMTRRKAEYLKRLGLELRARI